MKRAIGALLFLGMAVPAQATTTVTIDNNTSTPQTVVVKETPVAITNSVMAGDFEARVTQINYTESWIVVQDISGAERRVSVQQGMINQFRIGDIVFIHPTEATTLITLEENPRDFEGEIIRVDIPRGQILVLDTNGRERRVDMKQGMIGTYNVEDYVRVHLMADLKEAKKIETIRDMGRLDGRIVRVDAQTSRIVVRDSNGNERTVLVRQGLVSHYTVGNQVRVYHLVGREDVQLVRMIRVS